MKVKPTTGLYALAVLAGWNVRRVEIPWVRWCSECATAEHPFKPVRTSFHTVCLGVKHPSHRCTMEHHDCTMEHHDATGVSPETNGVKASPHRLKWMLTRGAPAEPSDPWNSHAAPASTRQDD